MLPSPETRLYAERRAAKATSVPLAALAMTVTAPAEHVRLALELRGGGAHVVRRAIELAATVPAGGEVASSGE